MQRKEFTNAQKAEIYARDKAICAFSGKILWILHYGASCLWDTDWVDHIKPAMKGGDNNIENGICASSFFNSKKKDNSFDNKFLFLHGNPTFYYYVAHGFLSDELKNHLINFKNIQPSDWFLNRAFQNLMISIEHLNYPYDTKGKEMKRDLDYWCSASFKNIIEWKKQSNNQTIEETLNRLSINYEDLGDDQKTMLEIIDANSYTEITLIAKKLLIFYQNSLKYVKNQELNLESFKTEKFLSLRDKKILTQNNYINIKF